jgi:hypothetical protein
MADPHFDGRRPDAEVFISPAARAALDRELAQANPARTINIAGTRRGPIDLCRYCWYLDI